MSGRRRLDGRGRRRGGEEGGDEGRLDCVGGLMSDKLEGGHAEGK